MITRALVVASVSLAVAACDVPVGSAKADESQATAIPPPSLTPTGRVTDEANILTDEEEAALTAKLVQIERDTMHQVAVVTVSNLGGQDVATFTDTLGKAWGVGREGHHDGVVVLVAPNERKARISVADGLLGKLTNADSRRIMGEQMVPNFRAGRFYTGLDTAIDEITKELNSNDSPRE